MMETNNRKLIFLDIDGTLVMPGHLPSQNLSRAIHVTRSRGNKVFLSTGRPEHAVSEAVKAIGFDGGIYCAGGVVVVGGRTILDLPMDASLTAHILEVVRKAKVFFTVECNKHNYSSSVSPKSQALADRVGMSSELQRVVQTGKDAPDMKPFADYRGEPVYKVGFMVHSNGQADVIERQLGTAVKVVRFANLSPDISATFCEISDRNINKGAALERVCQYMNATTAQCVAFGDSMNDIEILRTAGLGIAMGNAEEKLKASADRVCESCEDDGIVKELLRMGLA